MPAHRIKVNAMGHGPVEMPDRAKKRFQLFLRQLLEEGRSQDDVARMLGLSQASVCRIAAEQRGPTLDSVEHAIRTLKISPDFFFAAMPTHPHYRDYQGARKIPDPMAYAALARFLKNAEEMGLKLTDADRFNLANQEFDGDPTPETYMLLLQALRSVRMPERTEVRPTAYAQLG